MLPLTLDLASWTVLLTGTGPALDRRLALIRASGAVHIRVCAIDAPSDLPTPHDIACARLLFIAGLPAATAASLTAIARAHRVLVNAEDMPALCDFHVPALVRRGDLSIAISTNGRSPGLAAALRHQLAGQFDSRWADYTTEAATLRDRLRATGTHPTTIAHATAQRVTNWLHPDAHPA